MCCSRHFSFALLSGLRDRAHSETLWPRSPQSRPTSPLWFPTTEGAASLSGSTQLMEYSHWFWEEQGQKRGPVLADTLLSVAVLP